MFTWPLFAAIAILGACPSTAGRVTPPRRPAAEVSLSVREMLTKFEKNFQPTGKENWKVRMECLVKLMRIGPAAVPALVECLQNEKAPPNTRAFAVQALELFADARARPALLEAIEDKDGLVRAYAQHALGRLGRLKKTPRLLELAGEDWDSGRYFNLMVAMTRDDQPNPEPIRQALKDYDFSHMDSARLAEPAPDFTLSDASGKTWRLRQFRGKEAVVLIFLQGIN